jgi:two-component system, cell cycle response regulator DivK
MKKKILLVEDNAQNRYLTTFLLEKGGFETAVAETGNQALEFLKQEQPHLILMDIQLPDLDGYQVAAQIKSNPLTAMIPIIALTSFAMPGDRKKAEALGFAGYIEKPIDPEKFISQVEACFAEEKP